jgi:hypothetical protein
MTTTQSRIGDWASLCEREESQAKMLLQIAELEERREERREAKREPCKRATLAERARLASNIANAGKRKQVRDAQESSQQYYRELLEKLYQVIMKGWKDKVDEAAEKKYVKTNLFIYRFADRILPTGEVVSDTQEGSSIAFLLEGTKDNPDHWRDQGMGSVLDRVDKELSKPEHGCYLTYWDTGVNGIVVEACWDEEKKYADLKWNGKRRSRRTRPKEVIEE